MAKHVFLGKLVLSISGEMYMISLTQIALEYILYQQRNQTRSCYLKKKFIFVI